MIRSIWFPRFLRCFGAGALAACVAPDSHASLDGRSSVESEVTREVAATTTAPARPAHEIQDELARSDESWRAILSDRIAIFGHRNVIAVVESAYPAHSSPGIETIATRSPQGEVLEAVLAAIAKSGHVRPHALIDRELELVPESDAPGIDAFRAGLAKRLDGFAVEAVAHDDLVERLARASATFRVLILKTDLALPYSCVFLQLESGTWSDGAEKRLREAPEKQAPEKNAEETATPSRSEDAPPDDR